MLEIEYRCRNCQFYKPIIRSSHLLFASCSHSGEIVLVLGLSLGCRDFREDREKLGRLPLFEPEEAEEAQRC